MRFWPAYTASFTTSLSAKDAIARLHAEIGKKKIFQIIVGPVNSTTRSDEERRDFLGGKRPDGGEFVRNLNTTPGELRAYNSFQAYTQCYIKPAPEGAHVRAQMRLGLVPLMFLSAMIATLIFMNAIILTGPLEDSSSRWVAFTPLGMAAIFWLIACFAFSYDAERTERLLRASLERE